jgi:hypothetical protein
MKRRIAAFAVSGALLGGGVAVPLILMAEPASAAAPGGPWVVDKGLECGIANSPQAGTLYVNTINGRTLCFFG